MVATRDDVATLLDRALTRFATNQIHQNVREHDASLQVRVIDEDRIGIASTNRLEDAGIRDVVERAAAIARRSAPNPRAAILPEPDVREIDAAALGYVAATKGDQMRGAGELEPGEYEVILEEEAVAGLLEYLAYIGFSGLAHEEGRSFMDLGKRVMGDNVSIWDDGADPSGLPSPIDFEGVVRQRV